MAVTSPALRHFAGLKLRMIGNHLTSGPVPALLFTGGLVIGAVLGTSGFALLAASTAGDPTTRLTVASLAGAALVVGSGLLPLVWFGVDDTLDPARFALLPLTRRRLVAGLLVAALLSVPVITLCVATAGLLVPAVVHGGPVAGVGQAIGLLVGVLLCVSVGRAVTTAFATGLRSRRFRDLAGVLLACVAVLAGPLIVLLLAAAQRINWEQLTSVAAVIGWTPLGAPYTVGAELAAGRPLAGLAKLLIGAVAVVLMLWWWSRSLESAMVGAAADSPGATRRSGAANGPTRLRRYGGSAVAVLLPRLVPGIPRTAFGAIVAREIRYWWRDPKRRANLAMALVVGVLIPALVSFGGTGVFRLEINGESTTPYLLSPSAGSALMLFIGAFVASLLANQFGFDGTSYAAHLIASVPGRLELWARASAYAILVAPALLAVGVLYGVASGDLALVPACWGALATGYGAGVAVSSHLSVVAAYPLPEGSNPLAIGSGSALAKSLLAILSLVLAGLIGAPVLVAAIVLGPVWPWLAVPVGVGYGLLAAALGGRFAGDLLDRRGPELLASITPGR